MSDPITKRVIDWNAARYDQEYDYELATNLLLEETQELFDAKTAVDKLDAIGDITFVAIGVLWKLGFSERQIYDIFYVHDLTKISPAEAQHWLMNVQSIAMDLINHEQPGSWPGLVHALYSVFNTALSALRGMKCQNIFYDVVHTICDSNDTKEIKGKTPANVKANIDKGTSYKPPTDALFTLYSISISGTYIKGVQ